MKRTNGPFDWVFTASRIVSMKTSIWRVVWRITTPVEVRMVYDGAGRRCCKKLSVRLIRVDGVIDPFVCNCDVEVFDFASEEEVPVDNDDATVDAVDADASPARRGHTLRCLSSPKNILLKVLVICCCCGVGGDGDAAVSAAR